MHHPIRVSTSADMIAVKIRVERFDLLKQRSKSAMKNNTILSMERDFTNVIRVQRQETTYDHISNAQGRLK
jgi:hypothetical protein